MEFVREAQQALPLVPEDENDCCARLVSRTDLSVRDVAREWVTFLRALGLVEETSSGFRRLRHEFDRTELANAFRKRVFGAEIVREILTTNEPLGTDAVFERFRERVPNWERHRREDWQDEWHERVRRLLEWSVVFDLAECVDGEYRAA